MINRILGAFIFIIGLLSKSKQSGIIKTKFLLSHDKYKSNLNFNKSKLGASIYPSDILNQTQILINQNLGDFIYIVRFTYNNK